MKLEPPRLRYLGRIAGLAVYLVSGEYVRNNLDIDFTQGGNEAIYPTYIPDGEIWIDDGMHALDRTATAFHEIAERYLMLERGQTYEQAHDEACRREIVLRKQLVRRPHTAFDPKFVATAVRAFMREQPASIADPKRSAARRSTLRAQRVNYEIDGVISRPR